MSYYLILDVGTTNIKAIAFSHGAPILEISEKPKVRCPMKGWVEEDPEEVVEIVKKLIEKVTEKLGNPTGVGITNQRSSTVVWDKKDGTPLYNIITWQDTRTESIVEQFSSEFIVRFGNAIGKVLSGISRILPFIKHTRKGAYIITLAYVSFGTTHSSMHLRWLMDNVEGVKEATKTNKLAFGTLDSWVAWNLVGKHVTDYTNASATGLFDPFYLKWSDNITKIVEIPKDILPSLIENDRTVGNVKGYDVPLLTMIADQQASLYAAGVSFGSIKITHGTGSFIDVNVGEKPFPGNIGLYPMIALATTKKTLYMLEGSVITSGSAIDWLIDVGLMKDYSEIEEAFKSTEECNVVAIPALSGIGTPYVRPEIKGAMFGITRGTKRTDIIRGFVEGIAMRCAEVIEHIERVSKISLKEIFVDGGLSRSDAFLQVLADLSGKIIVRPEYLNGSAYGTYMLSKLVQEREDVIDNWRPQKIEKKFTPKETKKNFKRRWRDSMKALLKY